MKIYYVNTELEALGQTRKWRSAIQSTNKLMLQPDLDQLLHEKMETEIQCVMMTPLPDDQRVAEMPAQRLQAT